MSTFALQRRVDEYIKKARRGGGLELLGVFDALTEANHTVVEPC